MNTATLQSQKIAGQAGNLFVFNSGNGNIPIVYAHSFGGSHLHWQHQMEMTGANRLSVSFDFRGHGDSDPSRTNDYSAFDLANDIAAVADELIDGKFILVGHSMGGSAAIAYAGNNSGRLAGLFLSGTPGKSDPKMSEQIISSLESKKYQEVMEQYMQKLLSNSKKETSSLINREMKKISKEESISIIKSMFAFDPLPSLKKYSGKKFLLYTSMEKESGSLHSQVPDLDSALIEGTSHWIQLDKPEVFNSYLTKFIEGINN
jgi:pimeloyl-ACP methyl ester carboxylesterase